LAPYKHNRPARVACDTPIRHLDAAARSAWTGKLCVALAHRWEPDRQFMILTSYLDESGTHGGDVTIMAGFLADARQWRKFEKRTTKLRTLPRRYFSHHRREAYRQGF
jgi:hypothetical protein